MAAVRFEVCVPKTRPEIAEISRKWKFKSTHLDKIWQALGDVIKELGARTDHNTLWDGVDLWLHLEVVFALEVDEQNAEVRAA